MKRLTSLLLALVLIGAACGDDAPAGPTTTADTGFPVVVRGTTIDASPDRIVSASPTHTEILFALGAGDRVVAVDDFSDFPAEAAPLPHFDAFNASVEGIAGFDPDLVILAFDPGDVASGLAALGIATIVFAPPPVTLDEAYAEWSEVGDAVGVSAESLIDETRDVIATIVAQVHT